MHHFLYLNDLSSSIEIIVFTNYVLFFKFFIIFEVTEDLECQIAEIWI